MNDEHVITKLRGAALGGPPATLETAAAVAAQGHRLRRRRRVMAAGTASLSIASAALLALNFPGDTGQSVVQNATPGASKAPAGLGRATAPPDDQAELQRRRAANLARLRELLGKADWVSSPPPVGSLVLATDAAAARDLPAGDRAQASIDVHFQPPRAVGCPTQDPGGAPVLPCTVVPTADGGSATVERMAYRAGTAAAGDWTRVTYVRPDGATASAEMMVFSPSTVETAARDQRARAWLRQYDDLLVQAVADPAMQRDPGPPWSPDEAVPTPSPSPAASTVADRTDAAEQFEPHNRNMERLRQRLGGNDWQVQYGHKPQPVAGDADLVPGSTAAKRLPTDENAMAGMQVDRVKGTDMGCPATADPGVTCFRRVTPDGGYVRLVHRTVTDTPEPYIATEATYLRSDNTLVAADVRVYSTTSLTGDRLGRTRTWLNGYDDALVAAVADPTAEVEHGP